jgi:thiol-disulfide isomerase/thioredoxin
LVRKDAWRTVLYTAGLLLLFAYSVGPFLVGRDAPIPPGAPPPFLAQKPDGQQFKLEDLRGQGVLLFFFASWCDACRSQLPLLKELGRTYREKGLVVIGASLDDTDARPAALAEWSSFNDQDALPPVFPDEETAGHWRVETLPTCYLLDREGKILAGYVGYVRKSKLVEQIERALNAPSR